MTTWKQHLGQKLRKPPFYPHIYFFNHPFKAMEYAKLVKGIPFRSDDVILDIGCGAGLQTLLFGQKAAKIIGVDPDPNPIGRAISDHQGCAPGIPAEFCVATIEEARFPDSTFSKAFSVCVLEHIPDYMGALGECFRVLQPGGIFSFSCDSLEPIADEELKQKHAERCFIRHFFSVESIRNDLESIGFEQVEVYPIFRSQYAKELFEQGIREGFIHRYAKSIWLSWRLRWAELFARGDKGLFLIVRAVKPVSAAHLDQTCRVNNPG